MTLKGGRSSVQLWVPPEGAGFSVLSHFCLLIANSANTKIGKKEINNKNKKEVEYISLSFLVGSDTETLDLGPKDEQHKALQHLTHKSLPADLTELPTRGHPSQFSTLNSQLPSPL